MTELIDTCDHALKRVERDDKFIGYIAKLEGGHWLSIPQKFPRILGTYTLRREAISAL